MNSPTKPTSAVASTLVSYATCANAKVHTMTVPLSASDRAAIRLVLDRLDDLGVVTLADVNVRPLPINDLPSLFGQLRQTLGELVVDAAIGAAQHPATPTMSPDALIPLTQFARSSQSDGALVAFGRLYSHSLVLEAFPVREDGELVALRAASRFDRWCRGATDSRPIGTMHLPGHSGAHAVFAAVRAS